MAVAEMIKKIHAGERLNGSKVNLKSLKTAQDVAELCHKHKPLNMVEVCSRVDLEVMYYVLSGKEYTNTTDSRHTIAQEIIRLSKEYMTHSNMELPSNVALVSERFPGFVGEATLLSRDSDRAVYGITKGNRFYLEVPVKLTFFQEGLGKAINYMIREHRFQY